MECLYIDLLKLIFNKLDFINQIKFKMTCKYTYLNLHITDLYNIDNKYLLLLNDDILLNYKYLISLNAFNNIKNYPI